MTLISQLPDRYRQLAEKRRSQIRYWGYYENTCDELTGAFGWDYTPEGWLFWYDLDNGKHPLIPENSLAELEADT